MGLYDLLEGCQKDKVFYRIKNLHFYAVCAHKSRRILKSRKLFGQKNFFD